MSPECSTSNKSLPCPELSCTDPSCASSAGSLAQDSVATVSWGKDQKGLFSVTMTLLVVSAAIVYRLSAGTRPSKTAEKANS